MATTKSMNGKSADQHQYTDANATTTAGDGKLEAIAKTEWDAVSSLLSRGARAFLRGELGEVEPELPRLVSVLRAAGAGECYHKHGTFLAHLVDVYRILRLWGAPAAVARCGLFHSAYSNSYVNLAILQPDTGRPAVRNIVGSPAERLVHLFCVVPRHEIINGLLLPRYTDQELRDHLAASEEDGRVKLRSVVPPEGLVVRHIRTGEPVALPRRVVAAFLLMTVADESDQYTDYQDEMFENEDGRLELRGDNWAALWPGTGKPGLWVSNMSRVAALYCLIARDEQLITQMTAKHQEVTAAADDDDDDMAVGELVIPPVFERCSRVLDAMEQKAARDLYWEAVTTTSRDGKDPREVEALLRESIGKNAFVGEPHLVLAQVLLNAGRYEEAAAAAGRGVRLLLEWGCSWDKRVSWEGWVSWGRVMGDNARQRSWPRTAWGVISLGLVDGVANYN